MTALPAVQGGNPHLAELAPIADEFGHDDLREFNLQAGAALPLCQAAVSFLAVLRSRLSAMDDHAEIFA